jgi:hypothetical protein
MIAGLRRRHRRVIALGWLALPLVLSLAWTHRPPTVGSSGSAHLTSMLAPADNADTRAWYQASDLFEGSTIELSFRAGSNAQTLTLLAENLLEPNLLIYWTAEPTSSDDLTRARLLGRWASSTRAEVLMPNEWSGGGQLVLFSLGHMTVMARSRVLPQGLP